MLSGGAQDPALQCTLSNLCESDKRRVGKLISRLAEEIAHSESLCSRVRRLEKENAELREALRKATLAASEDTLEAPPQPPSATPNRSTASQSPEEKHQKREQKQCPQEPSPPPKTVSPPFRRRHTPPSLENSVKPQNPNTKEKDSWRKQPPIEGAILLSKEQNSPRVPLLSTLEGRILNPPHPPPHQKHNPPSPRGPRAPHLCGETVESLEFESPCTVLRTAPPFSFSPPRRLTASLQPRVRADIQVSPPVSLPRLSLPPSIRRVIAGTPEDALRGCGREREISRPHRLGGEVRFRHIRGAGGKEIVAPRFSKPSQAVSRPSCDCRGDEESKNNIALPHSIETRLTQTHPVSTAPCQLQQPSFTSPSLMHPSGSSTEPKPLEKVAGSHNEAFQEGPRIYSSETTRGGSDFRAGLSKPQEGNEAGDGPGSGGNGIALPVPVCVSSARRRETRGNLALPPPHSLTAPSPADRLPLMKPSQKALKKRNTEAESESLALSVSQPSSLLANAPRDEPSSSYPVALALNGRCVTVERHKGWET
mmetsp:Transcript_55253/g.108088  ORF Transcript_55253/g.108088 Transcript_55253/m.108088 type:complete len:538 (+) Transcript_55253:313-1926(+)